MKYRPYGLVLLLAGAAALLFGPSPAARSVGHRFTGANAVARKAGDAAARPAVSATPDAVPTTGVTAQPANPAPSGPPTTRPSGPAKPSASAGSASSTAGTVRRTGSDAVALTFDDGPDPVQTPRILDLLAEHGVKATFCLVGFRARDNPDLVRRIAADGHTLCNHSWQHLTDLARRPPQYVRQDLSNTNDAIRAAVPDARIAYFRAPGGNFTPELVATAHGLGMVSIYWQVDPRDWDHRPDPTEAAHVARVIAVVQRETRPGSIVLSHDNRQPATISAYRVLLPWLTARFRLVPLPV